MKHVSLKHSAKFVPLALLGAFFVPLLSGCPGGAELEDPGKYGLTGGNPSTGTGGTNAMGGTGGTTGGSAGTGTPPPMLTVDCGSSTYQTVLMGSCVSLGCHAATSTIPAASMLDLTPNDGLVSRLKDVKAKHGDITCGADFTACTPASCDPNALLVNSATPSASWILAKINNTQSDCGASMPIGGTLSAADSMCMTNLVNAIAALPK
jgi:hypothetical protein